MEDVTSARNGDADGRISVCCAEESHAGAPWFVGSFVRQWAPEVGPAGAWLWVEYGDYPGRDASRGRLTRATQFLNADQLVTQGEIDPRVFGENSRTRYRFHCKRCGLTVERKAPLVHRAFEILSDAGVREISLSALRVALDAIPS